MSANSPTIDIKKFLGLRNVAQGRRLPVGSLSVAQNVDIDDEGGIVSRVGYSKALNLVSCSSAYAPMHKDYAYVVDNGNLYLVDAALNPYLLGAVGTDDIKWCEAGNFVFLSSGHMVNGNLLLDWRVETPPAPICTTTFGNLSAGTYQLLMTKTTVDGRETGSSAVVAIELYSGNGINISNANGYNVYMTEANGSVFYYVGSGISVITTTANLTIPIHEPLILGTPLPDNIECIAFYDTSLYVSQYDSSSRTSTVYWSKPFRWHVFDVFGDYFQIPGEVRLLVGTPSKLIIGTERNIFAFDGDSMATLAYYGVPRGHQYALSQNNLALIYTVRGVCAIDEFNNLTLEKVSLAPGEYCSSAFVEQEGIEKFVVLTDATGTANNPV